MTTAERRTQLAAFLAASPDHFLVFPSHGPRSVIMMRAFAELFRFTWGIEQKVPRFPERLESGLMIAAWGLTMWPQEDRPNTGKPTAESSLRHGLFSLGFHDLFELFLGEGECALGLQTGANVTAQMIETQLERLESFGLKLGWFRMADC